MRAAQWGLLLFFNKLFRSLLQQCTDKIALIKDSAAGNEVSNLQSCRAAGDLVYAPLRSVQNMCHWHIAPLAKAAKYPCKHGYLARCSRE